MRRKRTSTSWFASGPKQPVPEHGIRMTKAGETWWGERWISALESVLRGDSARLARARTYARAGRAHDLAVKGGTVTAKVTGSRSSPYAITITLAQLSEVAWTKVIAGLAKKSHFSAELLAGNMSQSIEEVFVEGGVSLFPASGSDLQTSCSCPDWGNPCKHVAATHYVLGEALDRDPFLLFELRGMTKKQVLDALRAARSGADEVPASKVRATKSKSKTPSPPAASEVPTVKLGKVKVRDYDTPREPLPTLRFHFDAPQTYAAVLRQLGAPTAWRGEQSPADLLAPLVRAAAEKARRLAMLERVAEPVEEPPTDPQARGGAREKAGKRKGASG